MTPSALPNCIDRMHRTHGIGAKGQTCGDCVHCVNRPRPHPGRVTVVRYECLLADTHRNKLGRTMRAEWRKHWPACDAFQAEAA